MKVLLREHRFERTAVSLQSLGQRLSFVILLCAAVALLIAGRSNSDRMQQFGAFISDVAAPVLDLASRPAQLIRSSVIEIDQFFNAVSENHKLRAELNRLSAWQAAAQRLQEENVEFRTLLNVHDVPAAPYLSARVVGDVGSPFVHTVLVNAGAKQGLRKDMPVVGPDGLIGRVILAGNQVSRILLLSDINSRIPVRLEPGGHQAVLTGDNQNLPILSYLPAQIAVKPGDRLVTSGFGGVFPPGIPVGAIAAIETSAGSQPIIRIKTFSDENRLEFVRILKFSPPDDLRSGNSGLPEIQQKASPGKTHSGPGQG